MKSSPSTQEFVQKLVRVYNKKIKALHYCVGVRVIHLPPICLFTEGRLFVKRNHGMMSEIVCLHFGLQWQCFWTLKISVRYKTSPMRLVMSCLKSSVARLFVQHIVEIDNHGNTIALLAFGESDYQQKVYSNTKNISMFCCGDMLREMYNTYFGSNRTTSSLFFPPIREFIILTNRRWQQTCRS